MESLKSLKSFATERPALAIGIAAVAIPVGLSVIVPLLPVILIGLVLLYFVSGKSDSKANEAAPEARKEASASEARPAPQIPQTAPSSSAPASSTPASSGAPLTGGAAFLAQRRAAAAAKAEADKKTEKAKPTQPNVAAVAPTVNAGAPLSGSAAILARMKQQQASASAAAAEQKKKEEEAAKKAAEAAQAAKEAEEAAAVGDGSLYFMYGGEAASQIAKDLATEARSKGFKPTIMSMMDFKKPQFEAKPTVAVFIVETIENAQPSEEAGVMVRFFNRKKKQGETGFFNNTLKYSVLALGDTNLLLDRQTTTAKDCNQAGQALDGALSFLGAQRVCERGEANDAVGLEEGVDPWKARLWPQLAQHLAAAGGSAGAPAGDLKPLLILFGSQTGNSAELAKMLAAECPEHGIQAKCMAMSETRVERSLVPGTVVVMVVSSTGDGEPPDNCAQFYSATMRRANPPGFLRGIKYSVLGLGDQNYTKFMHVPRLFHSRFEDLGATCIYPRGEADEVEGIEEYFDTWKAGLWEPLVKALKEKDEFAADENSPANAPTAAPAAAAKKRGGGGGGGGPSAEDRLQGLPAAAPCRVELCWEDSAEPASGVPEGGDGGEDGKFSAGAPYWAEVSGCELMTAEGSDRRVLHLELALGASGLAYSPGDSVGVLPQNDPAMVQDLLARLGVEKADCAFRLAAVEAASAAPLLPHIRQPATPRAALTHACDISSPPRKSLLRMLAEHCGDKGERFQLLRLCSRTGQADFERAVRGEQPTLLALLGRFPSCRPPLAALLDALPPLAPRMYSIACAQEHLPDKLQVAFSVVKYQPAPEAAERLGVATNWLDRVVGPAAAAAAGVKLPVYLKGGGDFKPPADLSQHVIMIGPGTGVAPFRGFLQQRRARLPQCSAPGEAWLFFGCRRREEDYLYGDEFQRMESEGVLTKLDVAFSRAGAEKVYVQHRMAEHAAKLTRLILDGAFVYVCGDGAHMAKDVHAALVKMLEQHAGMTPAEVSQKLAAMIKDRKYIRDIWS